jgi:hypothetical protein
VDEEEPGRKDKKPGKSSARLSLKEEEVLDATAVRLVCAAEVILQGIGIPI